ncbi:dermonecrotic toxin SPH-like [Amblyomma americanum]
MELLWMKGPRDGATLVLITFLGLAAGAHRRPVYIIAHMVNSITDFDEAMRRGANAIEADVTFSHEGTAVKLFHGWPCDCLRECEAEERVHAFLNYVRRSTNSRKKTTTSTTKTSARRSQPEKQLLLPQDTGKYTHKLTLLFLDLKLGDVHENRKYAAGVDIAQKLLQHLWHGVPSSQAVNVLLSVQRVSDWQVLRGAINTIYSHDIDKLDKIGFHVSDYKSLSSIRDMYERIGIQRHRWQGDGITNCLSWLRPAGRLQNVIDNRDSQQNDHYVEKAYDWTLDMPQEIRRSLRRGVDGIVTNKPARVAEILGEKEFRETLRLANVADSPWTRFASQTRLPRLSCFDSDQLKDEDLQSVFEDGFSFLGRPF